MIPIIRALLAFVASVFRSRAAAVGLVALALGPLDTT